MEKLSLYIDGHETSIVIGRGLLGQLAGHSGGKLILLVDENVFVLNPKAFEKFNCILIPQGEKQKSLAFVETVFRKMVELEADRTSFLVGIGGGLVTDLAGFVASTFMRGIPFGFVSTTLLGQVDASIGGKNGVNLDGYKNMIGIIRQPEFVWCDLDLLGTLEAKELRSGFAEVIKYGAIKDPELFEYLEKNQQAILSREPEALEKVVSRSASIKVEIVTEDVSEHGDRKLLNFGHTLGHAIEKISGILHGEAIAIGMILASRMSVNLGFLQASHEKRIEKLIFDSGLPLQTAIGPGELFNTLLKDKKRSGTSIHFILLRRIGEAFIYKMDLDQLKKSIYDLY